MPTIEQDGFSWKQVSCYVLFIVTLIGIIVALAVTTPSDCGRCSHWDHPNGHCFVWLDQVNDRCACPGSAKLEDE